MSKGHDRELTGAIFAYSAELFLPLIILHGERPVCVDDALAHWVLNTSFPEESIRHHSCRMLCGNAPARPGLLLWCKLKERAAFFKALLGFYSL